MSADLRLILMRHAKAGHPAGAEDHARSLTERGRRDADRVAGALVEAGWVPDRALVSDAARTVETWAHMVGRMPRPVEVLTTHRLYLGGVEPFVRVVGETPPETWCVLALGHNPGWEEVVHWLSGETATLGTADAALLTGPWLPWREALLSRAWRLERLIRPDDPSPPAP